MRIKLIIKLEKTLNISSDLKDLNKMICKACGIREEHLPILRGKGRIWVDLLFHKKRKALCALNNGRFRNPRFYSEETIGEILHQGRHWGI